VNKSTFVLFTIKFCFVKLEASILFLVIVRATLELITNCTTILGEEMHKKDYYEVLNLNPNCTLQDVKKNYHKLALIWHPV